MADEIFTPPPFCSRTPSNTRNIKVHYSFDYAEQLRYPWDPLQPEPIYLLAPRKCLWSSTLPNPFLDWWSGRLWQRHQRCSKPHPLLLRQPWLCEKGCMPACRQLHWTEQEHLHGTVSCLEHKGGQFSRCCWRCQQVCRGQLCTTCIQHHCCSYTWLVKLLYHMDEESN